jgi:hypothetical protein
VELEIDVGDGYIQCVRARWLSWFMKELASARMLFSAGRELVCLASRISRVRLTRAGLADGQSDQSAKQTGYCGVTS